jgi:hypothetical protein
MRSAIGSTAFHSSVYCVHEHGVQRVEHRARHIPVEVVGGEVQGVGVGQQARQALGDGSAVFLADADVGCMNEVCMLTASSTPNQTRSMPSLSATGASSGTMMKDSSKKSRKKASTKTSMLTTIRKPTWPPGRPSSRCSTHRSPLTPEDQAEDRRADQDEDHEGRQLAGGFHRLLEQLPVQALAGQRPGSARRCAHRAAFGRRRDAEEDGAEHQEDQHQRRHQRGQHAQRISLSRAGCGLPAAGPGRRWA